MAVISTGYARRASVRRARVPVRSPGPSGRVAGKNDLIFFFCVRFHEVFDMQIAFPLFLGTLGLPSHVPVFFGCFSPPTCGPTSPARCLISPPWPPTFRNDCIKFIERMPKSHKGSCLSNVKILIMLYGRNLSEQPHQWTRYVLFGRF